MYPLIFAVKTLSIDNDFEPLASSMTVKSISVGSKQRERSVNLIPTP
jgi:hypothetical protein